jgi:hypothetical protein
MGRRFLANARYHIKRKVQVSMKVLGSALLRKIFLPLIALDDDYAPLFSLL